MVDIKKLLYFLGYCLIIISCNQSTKESMDANNKDKIKKDNSIRLSSFNERNRNYNYSNVIGKKLSTISKKQIKVLTPNLYKSWGECLKKNKDIKVFILKPGTYTDWQRVSLHPKMPKLDKEIYILSEKHYQDILDKKKLVHPYNYEESDKVYAAGFYFIDTRKFYMGGLTFYSKNVEKKGIIGTQGNLLRDDSSYNIIDYCYFKDICKTNAIVIGNSSFNKIQNCVFEQSHPSFNTDLGAISIRANRGKQSIRNEILNNEIINWNDGMGIVRQISKRDPKFDKVGSGAGTVIKNNDFYLTDIMRVKIGDEEFAYAENAIDCKQGTKSNLPEDKIRIIGNRFWGYRYTNRKYGSSGSGGSAIALHRDASNFIIEENIIFDCPVGIRISKTNPRYPDEKTENITIRNNIFYNIKDYSNFKYDGTAFYLGRGAEIEGNIIVNTPNEMIFRTPRTSLEFNSNVIINNENKYVPKYKKLEKTQDLRYLKVKKQGKERTFSCIIKQWTNPETKYFWNLPKNIDLKK